MLELSLAYARTIELPFAKDTLLLRPEKPVQYLNNLPRILGTFPNYWWPFSKRL